MGSDQIKVMTCARRQWDGTHYLHVTLNDTDGIGAAGRLDLQHLDLVDLRGDVGGRRESWSSKFP